MPQDTSTPVSAFREDDLVERLTKDLPQRNDQVEVGPGDDCALLPGRTPEEWLLSKTDAMVEDVHFRREGMDAALVGRKAVARTVSDFAAMGGRPESMLITVAMPRDLPLNYADGLFAGFERAAKEFSLSVAGGEVSSSPQSIFISIAMLGWARKDHVVLRSGGKPGDLLFVTGCLGGSFASGRHLTFIPRVEQAAWLVENFLPHAMMDLSDGLAADLPRLARASSTGYRVVESRLPLHPDADLAAAWNDGEDYELLFALPPERGDALLVAWEKEFSGTVKEEAGLSCIGELTKLPAGTADPHQANHEGGKAGQAGSGYDHFHQP